MSTRSFIGKQLTDGSITGVYCHFDGYPDGVGATLKEHYVDPTKVDALLALGSISSLGPEIGQRHDYNDRSHDWTTAYHRDCGERLEPAMKYDTLRDMLRSVGSNLGAEYAYVFNAGAWETYEPTL